MASGKSASKRDSTALGEDDHHEPRKAVKSDHPAANGNGSSTPARRPLILHAFVEMCMSLGFASSNHVDIQTGSGHQSPGLWRHPDDESWRFNDIHHWVDLAKLLEDAGFHGIFIADVLGGYDVYKGSLDPAKVAGTQWPVNEPLAVVAAMGAATKSIGFGVTVSTSYETPYHLARRLSTIDHLTKGRLGWNVVTGYLDSAARNMLGTKQLDHDERYALVHEYLEVTYKLWESSWRDDAVIMDRKQGVYTDPQLVREINHKGKYFNVPGPHPCQPSPQRTPLMLQAGASKPGRDVAARHAEVVFVSGFAPRAVANNISDIRRIAKEKYGRDPRSLKFLSLATVIVDETMEKAQAKFDEYMQYALPEGALALFCGWVGIDLDKYAEDEELRNVESNAVRSTVEAFAKFSPEKSKWTKRTVADFVSIGGVGPVWVGDAKHIVDCMETWVAEADVDGFNLAYAVMPQSYKDIIKFVLPEMKRRGLFWDGYAVPGGTMRENLYGVKGHTAPRSDHVASAYRWRAGVAADDCPVPS